MKGGQTCGRLSSSPALFTAIQSSLTDATIDRQCATTNLYHFRIVFPFFLFPFSGTENKQFLLRSIVRDDDDFPQEKVRILNSFYV